MKFILAPDVLVNASVALGSPPEAVVKRTLGGDKKVSTSEWVLARVEGMFKAIPQFKPDAVTAQMELIRGLVEIVEIEGDFGPDAWKDALVATAKKAEAGRVVTDHPDLVELDTVDGIEFMSTEAWLLESATPPPPPV